MDQLSEARYGRASLLVLNICPFTLRHVIADYYTQHGSLSFQDFLLKQKHNLFHLLQKSCCCRRQQSRTTPMYRSQWELLYMRKTSPCQRGQQGDCPCQHDAKPGVTTSVMDVTLCCLMIKNTCPGINMPDVDAIRDIRNNLIHAESARLDQRTFNGYWKRVKTAILSLASNVRVPFNLYTDTINKIEELENRVMDSAELGELKKLIIDEKRFQDLEENVSSMSENIAQVTLDVGQAQRHVSLLEMAFEGQSRKIREMQQEQLSPFLEESLKQGKQIVDLGEHIDDHGRKMDYHFRQMDDLGRQTDYHGRQIDDHNRQMDDHGRQIEDHDRQIDDHGRQIDDLGQQMQSQEAEISDIKRQMPARKRAWRLPGFIGRIFNRGKQNISKLMKILIKINDEMTQVVQLSPLQERGEEEMPLEMLYASVVIREDPKYAKKGSNSHQKFEIQTPDFTDSDSVYKRLHGKRVSQHTREVTPDSIFKVKGDSARNIYMLGDATHGKTTYCLWLLKKWCNAQQKDRKRGKTLDEWEKALHKFDFVFLLQFRNVNPNLASVIDMICQDIFESDKDCNDAIRHVLSSDKYRSLIIMDGLDEWNPYEETKRQLTCKGIPNIPVSSSVSCFFSMRPWVFPTILKRVKTSDIVIEILGLSETGMAKVIENVLLNHYMLKDDPSKYTSTYKKIVRHLKEKNLKSFMQIPLLAVVCVQIWYKEKQVGDSMTSFYAVMVDMLIERAYEKLELKNIHDKTLDGKLPQILSEKENVANHISVLLKLGKVAYEGLLSHETNLVFEKRKLQKEIGERELQFALDVGLISQKEAPSLTAKNVSVHFFHKSIQEFLAVIYIVTKKEVSDLFCKRLSNVKVIMELSNVIMFICGIYPSLGSVISQCVVSVTDSDPEICRYRETPKLPSSTVKELYKLQVIWYRELQYRQTENPLTQTDKPVTQTNSPVTFHVSDVYLDRYNNDTETVRVTRKLLSDPNIDIRSLKLVEVPAHNERGISNTELDDFLSNKHCTRSLIKLYIDGYNTDTSLPTFRGLPVRSNRSVPKLCVPTLRCLHLEHVTIYNHLGGNVCPPLLTDMSQLRVLELLYVTLGKGGLGLSPDMAHIERICMEFVTLGEGGLGLSPDMAHIEWLELMSVNMPAARWGEFVRSVSNIQHRFDVVLHNANIDDVSLTMIRSSPDFTETQDGVDKEGEYELHFTRIWPPSQLTQDDELVCTRMCQKSHVTK